MRFAKLQAFTLVELAMVIVVLALIATFALPNYQKAIARGEVRAVRNNLIAIQTAQTMYRARNGTYWPTLFKQGPFTGLSPINNELGINLTSNIPNIIYECHMIIGWGQAYSCSAAKTGNWGFTMSVTQASATPACVPTNGAQNPC